MCSSTRCWRACWCICAPRRSRSAIDTHAGQGAYDLDAGEAKRTGEWRGGIGRLVGGAGKPAGSKGDRALSGFLAPYLEAVAAWREAHGASSYPGSPAIIRHYLRADDRLVATEVQERSFAKLARLFPPGSRAKALHLDGYTAWSAYVPPKERRGLVVVDPPFEAPNEFTLVAEALAVTARKWPSGMALIWYPAKDLDLVRRFAERLARLALPELWRVELDVGGKTGDAGLTACGLILVNPPWTLPAELEAALPLLATLLARGQGAGASCRRIAAVKEE
jgi:23S rRNA (adenine2030-N6)-methyltransferase